MSKSVTERKVENPDDEFGIAAETTSALSGQGGTLGEKGKGKEEENGLEFLDYVTCSLW